MPAAPARTLQWQLSFDANRLQDVLDGHRRLNDKSRQRSSSTILLETNWGMSRRWSLSLLLTWIQQERTTRQIGGPNKERVVSRGIGDAVFLLKYNAIVPHILRARQWTVGLGVKMPLGKASLAINGIRLIDDMQPGSGAWDIIFWSYGWQQLTASGQWGLVGIFSYRLTGENAYAYRFGKETLLTVGVTGNWQRRLAFSLLGRYRHVQPDRRRNVPISNTGGDWFYGILQVNWIIAAHWQIRWSGHVPLYRNLRGTQLTTSYRWQLGIFWEIPLSKSTH